MSSLIHVAAFLKQIFEFLLQKRSLLKYKIKVTNEKKLAKLMFQMEGHYHTNFLN